MIRAKVDTRILRRKVDKVTKQVIIGIGTEVRTIARVYAATIAKWTAPFGAGPERPSGFAYDIGSDIRRSQTHMDEIGDIWKRLEAIDSEKAKLLWAAMKKGKKTLARKLLHELAQMAGMTTGPLSPEVHRKARTGKKEGVPRRHRATHIITQGSVKQRDAYVKRRQKAIGRAKAGWAAAAKALGGAVSKREGFQSWFNTGQHKEAKGSARTKTLKDTQIQITLYNKVPWAGLALTAYNKQKADIEVLDRIDDALEKRAKHAFKEAMK